MNQMTFFVCLFTFFVPQRDFEYGTPTNRRICDVRVCSQISVCDEDGATFLWGLVTLPAVVKTSFVPFFFKRFESCEAKVQEGTDSITSLLHHCPHLIVIPKTIGEVVLAPAPLNHWLTNGTPTFR